MKCIVLAAGYGTRMQGLIGDTPKALVPLGRQVLLDTLMQRLDLLELPTYLVTNSRYHDQFQAWQAKASWPIDIIDDGSTEPANRLGAVGDLAFAIDRLDLNDDLLLLAADNLIEFPLQGLVSAFLRKQQPQVAVWQNPDMEDQKRRGVVTLDDNLRVTSYIEKPSNPLSNLTAVPIYVLSKACLTYLDDYIGAGYNTDAPGHFMSYLASLTTLYGWPVPGEIFDVGHPASYHRLLETVELQ